MSDLNDYLDGRLGPEEREAFERRLESDPELGRRLEAAHEVRAALRSGDEELSPGFYTRTVARFEAERRPRTPLPFGLTWSTAGLAAAGLAAAAIFIPLMLRDEIPMPATSVAEAEPSDATEEPAAPGRKPAAADEKTLASLGYAGAEEGAESAQEKDVRTGYVEEARSHKKKEAAVDRDAPEASRQVALEEPAPQALNEPFAPDPQTREYELSDARLDESAADVPAEPKRRVVARKRDKLAPPPPPAAVARPEVEAVKVAVPTAAEDAEESFANYRTDVGGVQSAGEGAKGVAAVTLPDSHVPPGVVRISGPMPEQDDVIRMSGAAALAQDTTVTAARFLLVGTRRGLDDCAELRLLAHVSHWEVSFDEEGSAEGSVACGLLIPSDGREIRFMGKRVDE